MLLEAVKLGHKIAIYDIPAGQNVLKFGVAIGRASKDIRAGQWVHLHNLTSDFDERSQTLDLHTGAATDTKYE
jgi:altronate dehydratase